MNKILAQSGQWLLGGAAITVGMQFLVLDAEANPTGMSVAAGTATAQNSGSTLTVTTGNSTVLNWQSFNIGAGESTVFNMPSANSTVLNNIGGASASQIYGSLQANGMVVLVNPYGFYLGPNAFVKAPSLVFSTASCVPPQSAGGGWQFSGPPPTVPIVNYGTVQTAAGGSLFLIADQVQNHGLLEAPEGTVGLAAGKTVLLTDRPDGRGMSMSVTLPQGSVANDGRIVADAGTLLLNAQVVNQNGQLQANSVREVNGQIELVASDTVNLGAQSQISAAGDNSAGGSNGGTVTIQAGGTFRDAAGSQIVTAGGANGGNGGGVEVSAPDIASLSSTIDAGASAGGQMGTFLLDPANIIVSSTAVSGATGSGLTSGSLDQDGTAAANSFFNLVVGSTLPNITGNITLQAAGNIYLANGRVATGTGPGRPVRFTSSGAFNWNLSTTTGRNTGLLTLEAGSSIFFGDGSTGQASSITDANSWNISLEAANIYLNGASGASGAGSLSTGAGNIRLIAGTGLSFSDGANSITTASSGGAIQLGSGSVSAATGNITWQAKSGINVYGGSVATGTGTVALNAGYNFSTSQVTQSGGSLSVNGSVSTASGTVDLYSSGAISLSGGSVSSTAGGNIVAEAATDLTLGNNGTVATSGAGTLTLAAGYNFTSGSVSQSTANPPAGNLYLNGGNGQDNNGSVSTVTGQLTLLAGGTLQLGSGTISSSGGNIVAEAGSDVSFYDNASAITDGNGGSVTLEAGAHAFNPAITAGAVQTGQNVTVGTGSINLGGPGDAGNSGFIQTDSGAINLTAGQDITVGSGYVISTAGGSIFAHALAGNLNTGSDAQGYVFKPTATTLAGAYTFSDPNSGNRLLGGISTMAGGNVTLEAGSQVSSYLPSKGNGDSGAATTAGAGAYGVSAPGNVTVVAGTDVTGNFMVANGTGTIIAGAQIDGTGNPVKNGAGNYVLKTASTTGGDAGSAGGTLLSSPQLSLDLVQGGWNVAAAQNVLLLEVVNPNGVFDYGQSGKYNHLFDYNAGAFLNVFAQDSVQFGGKVQQLIRQTNPNDSYANLPTIYPPILNVEAQCQGGSSSWGVQLSGGGSSSTFPNNSLTLLPSPQGSLTINTPGSLVGSLNSSSLFSLTMGDFLLNSSLVGFSLVNPTTPPYLPGQYLVQYGEQTAGATVSPVHLNSSTPVELSIGTDMNLINLSVAEAAQLYVGGNMVNCGFAGMNLAATPAVNSSIPVANGPALTLLPTYANAPYPVGTPVTVNPAGTTIDVTGTLYNRGAFTSVPLTGLPALPDLSQLGRAVTSGQQPSGSTLQQSFFLNGSTLTYESIPGAYSVASLKSILTLLDNLPVQVYANGQPQWQNPPYDNIPTTTTINVLGDPNTAGTAAYQLLQAYSNLGPTPASAPGYTVGGGGTFQVTARTIDLGSQGGISTYGPGTGSPYPLASLFAPGGAFYAGAGASSQGGASIVVTTTGSHADANPDVTLPVVELNLSGLTVQGVQVPAGRLIPTATRVDTGDTAGDLDMLSSSVASQFGGSILVNVGGDVNAGSSLFTFNSAQTRGIFTTSGGDVEILATGSVLVNGSRIAAYNGGNLTVVAENGTVDAGNGQPLAVNVTSFYETDTGSVVPEPLQLSYTGILALTFPHTATFTPNSVLGNILIEAPNGAITAKTQGVLQSALTGITPDSAIITLLSGYELLNNSGGLLLAGELSAFQTFDNVTPPSPVTGPYLSAKVLDGSGNQVGRLEWTSANQNIDVSGSGVLGASILLDATGSLIGNIVALNNANLQAVHDIGVTAVAGGRVNASSASGNITGNIIASGGVSVSGLDVSANLVSSSVSGATSGQSGLGSGNTAGGSSTAAGADQSSKTATTTGLNSTDETSPDKKKGKSVALAQKISRVTVLLPGKNN